MATAPYQPFTDADLSGLRRFSREEFLRLTEGNILEPDQPLAWRDGLVWLADAEEPTLYPFSVRDYYWMAATGLLDRNERTELINGGIYTMCPIGSRHAGCLDFLTEIFVVRLSGRAQVRTQNPVRLSDLSEPEPDIALLHPRERGYRSRHPGPDDVFLIVEIMETSAARDRGVKLADYAASMVPEVWLVDLKKDLIEIHAEPEDGRYKQSRIARAGERIAPGAFPDVVLSVDEILGLN